MPVRRLDRNPLMGRLQIHCDFGVQRLKACDNGRQHVLHRHEACRNPQPCRSSGGDFLRRDMAGPHRGSRFARVRQHGLAGWRERDPAR